MKWLPDNLPRTPQIIWTVDLPGEGIGSIAVAEGCVVVATRDVLDVLDVIQCFDANTGEHRWKHIYEAKGTLDYGNSARAAPLVHDGNVYTLGAFGDLYCLELESGLPLWNRNLVTDFDAEPLTWGHSGSPLICDDKLIVQPGGKDASLVALDIDTGETLWQCPGEAASYSSFMPMMIDGKHQIVGFDFESLGAWDVSTGERLWKHVPRRRGDFNVPTALIDQQRNDLGNRLIVSSENNGTRILGVASDGTLNNEPVAMTGTFSPDTHTPVLVNGMVVGVHNALYALKIDDHFQTVRELDDSAFESYCSIIASDNRALILNLDGELLLVSVDNQELKILSRLKFDVSPGSVYSHPAVADRGLYLRLGRKLVKMRLIPDVEIRKPD